MRTKSAGERITLSDIRAMSDLMKIRFASWEVSAMLDMYDAFTEPPPPQPLTMDVLGQLLSEASSGN